MWSVIQLAVAGWSRHKTLRLGAALAYYSVFSLGPLLLIVISVAGLFLGEESVRAALTSELRTLLGDTGNQAIEAMLKGAGSRESGHATALIGLVLFIIAALSVVLQLKDALNTIWEAEEPEGAGLLWYIRSYAVSLLGIVALGFLLTVSLVATAAIAAVSTWLRLSAELAATWEVVNAIVSLGILTVLFAMLFKWFPDCSVSWKHVWMGAFVTALLFSVGKTVIAWYVGSLAMESTYGAAASIVILLVWVYYSAQIVLFGAELTHAAAQKSVPAAKLPASA